MKRFVTLLLCIFICLSCTGCDALDKIIDKAESGIQMNKISESVQLPRSNETKKAEKAYEEATKARNAAQEDLDSGGFSLLPPFFPDSMRHPVKTRNLEKAKAHQDRTYSDYEITAANDSILQTAMSKRNDTKQTNWMKIGLIAIGVLVGIVLLLSLMKRKSKDKQDVVIPKDTGKRKNNVGPDAKIVNYKVDYEKLLHKNCEQLNMDYETTLTEYNGDARKAFESTNYMIQKNKFG